MNFSTISEIATNRGITDSFLGYNHNLRIGDGEFYDMKNMTSQFYPVLSTRPKRGLYLTGETRVNGLIAKNSLCYV